MNCLQGVMDSPQCQDSAEKSQFEEGKEDKAVNTQRGFLLGHHYVSHGQAIRWKTTEAKKKKNEKENV